MQRGATTAADAVEEGRVVAACLRWFRRTCSSSSFTYSNNNTLYTYIFEERAMYLNHLHATWIITRE